MIAEVDARPRHLRAVGSPPPPARPPAPAPAGDGPAPTWEALVAREPRLAELLAEAQAARDDPDRGYCRNVAFRGLRRYGPPDPESLRRRLGRLVGTECARRDPAPRSPAAYKVAFRVVFHALPPCRLCHCSED
jgi:hypothetical protein